MLLILLIKILYMDVNLIDSVLPEIREIPPVLTEDKEIKQISESVISPVLTYFVWWVLINARERKIKRLYFLARDGYIMYKIAERFCNKFKLDIECRYLYSSRIAWRTAVYHLIGDEKYNHIFTGGYFITPRIILKRTQADKTQRHDIYRDINQGDLFIFDENKPLNDSEAKEFSEKLKKSKVFNEYLHNISLKQFHDVSEYLKQEGLFENNDITIVDSGWTGSIQRTLRQIAENHIKNPNITGFYFGLYTDSNDTRDGEYISWYFSGKSPVRLMTKFNNNVFECMCATPFDMTISYKTENGIYIPVFGANSNSVYNTEISKYKNYCIEYFTTKFIANTEFDKYNDSYLKKSRKILQRFMIYPTKEEAKAFGRFTFCDDASEAYKNTLTTLINKKYLKNYTFMRRAYKKLTKKNKPCDTQPDLFWFHGSAAVSDIRAENWYRFNYWSWETLRLIIKKYRKDI